MGGGGHSGEGGKGGRGEGGEKKGRCTGRKATGVSLAARLSNSVNKYVTCPRKTPNNNEEEEEEKGEAARERISFFTPL